MVFRLIAPDRLKITLTPQDAGKAGVSWESEDPADLKQLRRYLLGLLAQAQSQSDTAFFLTGERLLIEIYPDERGGATVFFTTEHRLPSHSTLYEPVALCFADAQQLIDGAVRLFSLHGHRLLQSALYHLTEGWLLVVHPMDGPTGPAVALLAEYGAVVAQGALATAVLTEHSRPILQEQAVDLLAHYFS